ncbi:MAG: GNAT family N-acetyltransferase [Bacteroidales bacterium]|nr:GNAT family N-acetyltransferase [Bacteroidales bacterium]
MKFNIAPTRFDLEKIKEWLIEEEQESNEGFYCNWNIIEKAFNNDELITLNLKEKTVGFLVWSKGEIYAEIDIMEIKPDYRKQGIGKLFFEQISEFFKQKGFLVIKLFCSPRESEKFWKKMGFIKFPDRGYSESDLTYFKPLIKVQTIVENQETDDTVELWDVEPYQKNNNQPKWTWNINLDNGKLKLPIIQPCNCNWNLRWSKKGEMIREDKVKYFDTTENRVEYSPFLYITNLIK